jgi:hypothetical protein
VLENALRKGTRGKIYPIKEYRLMKRAHFQKMGNSLALTLDVKNVPLEMDEARNAVHTAKSRGAEKYAPKIFAKADGGLKMAENALARKADKKDAISSARSAAQFGEDARALAAQRQEEERIAAEKAPAASNAMAEAEAKEAGADESGGRRTASHNRPATTTRRR